MKGCGRNHALGCCTAPVAPKTTCWSWETCCSTARRSSRPADVCLSEGCRASFGVLRKEFFDQEDLARRTDELVEFLRQAAVEYRFDPARSLLWVIPTAQTSRRACFCGTQARSRARCFSIPWFPSSRRNPPYFAALRFSCRAAARSVITVGAYRALGGAPARVGCAGRGHQEPSGHELVAPEVDAAQRWMEQAFPSRRAPNAG